MPRGFLRIDADLHRAAGRRWRRRTLPSLIGTPLRNDRNTRSFGPSARTSLKRFLAPYGPYCNSPLGLAQRVNPLGLGILAHRAYPKVELTLRQIYV
jgi:hypothetical protein